MEVKVEFKIDNRLCATKHLSNLTPFLTPYFTLLYNIKT